MAIRTYGHRVPVGIIDADRVVNAHNIGTQSVKGKYIAFWIIMISGKRTNWKSKYLYWSKGMQWCVNYSTFLSDDIHRSVSVQTSPMEFSYRDMLNSNRIGNLTRIYNRELLGTFYQERYGPPVSE